MMEKNQNLQPESLYLHLVSSSLEGSSLDSSLEDNCDVLYKIDSTEANFSTKPNLIAEFQQAGCGSAICGSILYLFGGFKNCPDAESWKNCPHAPHGECIYDQRNQASYLDLASCSREESSSFVRRLKHKMISRRVFPKSLTIGKNIYIFGSDIPGYGDLPSRMGGDIWAEVFNTEHQIFKPLSSPPDILFEKHCLGVSSVVEQNKILIATYNFSDLFIYDVETDLWNHKPMDTISPFILYSLRAPVIDKYIFLYGNGKICAFDKEKNQFLKNNLSLLEWALFTQDDEETLLHGIIHHLGGWKFCVVFSDEDGHVVRFVHVVSFEIENPERCGELIIKAGTINVIDHVLRGHSFIDALLWSNQIVPSGNPNNGKGPHKNNLIVGGQSSIASHVDDDCVMDYGATSRPDADLSKLQRKQALVDKEILELRLIRDFWRSEIHKLERKLPKSLHNYHFYLDKLERSQRELSKPNMDDGIKIESVSEKKTESAAQDEISILERMIAQRTEKTELIIKIDTASELVRSCLNALKVC